jgi:hypothetical protein
VNSAQDGATSQTTARNSPTADRRHHCARTRWTSRSLLAFNQPCRERNLSGFVIELQTGNVIEIDMELRQQSPFGRIRPVVSSMLRDLLAALMMASQKRSI